MDLLFKKVSNIFIHLEDDNFKSFTKFSFIFFRMNFFTFQSKSENADLKTTVKYYFRLSLFWFGFACCAVGFSQIILYAAVNFGDFNAVVRASSDAATVLLAMSKGLLILLRKDDVLRLLSEIKELIANQHNAGHDMKIYVNKYYRIAKFYLVIFISGHLVCAAPLILYLVPGSMSSILVYWFPFEIFKPTIFPLAIIWTEITMYFMSTLYLASDLLFYAIVTIISMEFDFLKTDLKNLKFETSEIQKIDIKEMIDRHNNLFELSSELNRIFGPSFLLAFTLSSFTICMRMFHFLVIIDEIMAKSLDIIALSIVLSQIWLLCFFGQKLIDSSSGIADGVYESDWINIENNNYKKQLLLKMLRSQRSIKLTAMGFADISLETFATVSKYI